MARDNGGIIGVTNNPTSSTATGVWSIESQYQARVGDTWPERALFTTKSLRFNDGSSDYLTESVSSTSNRRTFTYSAWIKRSSLSGSGYPRLFNPFVNSANFFDIFFRNTDALNVYSQNADSNDMNLVTNRLFRDFSAWYHIVVAVDTTQGTAANRVKLYVNGTQETSFSTATYPSQNTDFQINLDTVTNVIGRNQAGSDNYFDGYMSEVIFIDGQQLAPTSFGSTNSDGVWIPAIYTGTFGTNGFNLQFENASALGTDSSPNGNTFTVNNLTSIDQSTDYPVVNYATLNSVRPLPTGFSLSEGNLKFSTASGSNTGNVNSTILVNQGKWYAECKIGGGAEKEGIGAIGENELPANHFGSGTQNILFNADIPAVFINGSETSVSGVTPANNDILGMALDLDNGRAYFSVNGTYINSGNPSSGSGYYSFTVGSVFWGIGSADGSSLTGSAEMNYGSPSFAISSGNADGNGYGNFEYAVPSGYYALNTKNLGEFG